VFFSLTNIDKALKMKTILTILGIANGGFMLLDGIYVILKGKYIGPEKPGPWSIIFNKFEINVFKLGPLFISLGILWLLWLYGLTTCQPWAFSLGITVSILTLWYIPVGTIFSLTTLGILLFARQRLGI